MAKRPKTDGRKSDGIFAPGQHEGDIARFARRCGITVGMALGAADQRGGGQSKQYYNGRAAWRLGPCGF